MHRRSVLVGRLLAALVGVVWFVLLIFAGIGLIFGPMAWLAAAAGRAFPRFSAMLLLLPALTLVVSWLPILLDPGPYSTLATSLLIVALLTLPAVVAAALILRQGRPTDAS